MEKGLIQIYYGDGKGKTTAAIGQGMRFLGHNKQILIFQFLKGRTSGEIDFLNRLDNVKIIKVNSQTKFSFQMNDEELIILKKEITDGIQKLRKILESGSDDLIILDELLDLIKKNYIEEKFFIDLINSRKNKGEIIITGHYISPNLIAMSDLVTEVKKIKHPYDLGIKARKGVEF